MEKHIKKNLCRVFMKNLKDDGIVIELEKEKKSCFLRRGLIIESLNFEFDTIIRNRYRGRRLIVEKIKKISEKEKYIGMWLGDSFSKLDRLDILYSLNICYSALKDDGIVYLSFCLGEEDKIVDNILYTCFIENELIDFVSFTEFLIVDINVTDKLEIILKK